MLAGGFYFFRRLEVQPPSKLFGRRDNVRTENFFLHKVSWAKGSSRERVEISSVPLFMMLAWLPNGLQQPPKRHEHCRFLLS